MQINPYSLVYSLIAFYFIIRIKQKKTEMMNGLTPCSVYISDHWPMSCTLLFRKIFAFYRVTHTNAWVFVMSSGKAWNREEQPVISEICLFYTHAILQKARKCFLLMLIHLFVYVTKSLGYCQTPRRMRCFWSDPVLFVHPLAGLSQITLQLKTCLQIQQTIYYHFYYYFISKKPVYSP